MPKTGIIIDRPPDIVWEVFTKPEGWKKWWGGDLKQVAPGWQDGAKLIWADGSTSEISGFSRQRMLQFTSAWMQTAFRFTSKGNHSTRVEIEFAPRGGAAFNDGGQAHKASLASSLEKLKRYVEVGICWFCKTRPTVASAVVEVKLRGNGEVERMPKHERTIRNEVTIRVPRCALCKSKYRKARHIDEVGKLVVFILLLAGCGLTTVIGNLGTWFVVLWLIALGAMCVGILFGFGYWKDKVLRGIEEKQAVDFPEVQMMKEQGMEVTWWSRP